jgi:hypothetical protein
MKKRVRGGGRIGESEDVDASGSKGEDDLFHRGDFRG